MTNKVLPEGHLTFGEGNISGYIACLLAILSFLGVLAFHFPQYLTTPELRQAYDVDLLRQVMFVSLVISGSLGLLNFIRNRRKRLGLVAWGFIAVTIALGGSRVEVQDWQQGEYYLGLDWFILDLLGSTLIFVLIEKLIPHRREQPVLRPEWQGDMNHFLVNHLIVGFVLLLTNKFVHGVFGWAVFPQVQSFINDAPCTAPDLPPV